MIIATIKKIQSLIADMASSILLIGAKCVVLNRLRLDSRIYQAGMPNA